MRDLWRLRPQVLSAVRRRGVDPATAEDIASEVYLIAWRRLDAVPEPPGEALAWLRGAARLVLRNHARSARRQAALAARLVAVPAPRPAPGAATRSVPHVEEDRLVGVAAWRSLAPTDREVLRLVGVEGLGLDGLASTLGCGRGAAAMRVARARGRLERALSA